MTTPWLLVMRHGPAESSAPAGDAARRLSAVGRERTRLAANALARMLPAPACIYTSPLARARETAELLAAAFGTATPLATPLLAPGFNRSRLADELARSEAPSFAIVGHEPDLSEFVGWLIGGSAGARVKFGKGSAGLIDLARPGAAVLHALYPLDSLAPPHR
ncbi:MAG: SixA phosphatase family protein [Gammaproteobacteria bacterium]